MQSQHLSMIFNGMKLKKFSFPRKSGTNDGMAWRGINFYDYHGFQMKSWCAFTYAKSCMSSLVYMEV